MIFTYTHSVVIKSLNKILQKEFNLASQPHVEYVRHIPIHTDGRIYIF